MFSSFSFYLFYYHYYYFFFPFFLFFYYTSCTLFPTNKPLHPQCRRLIILEYEGELYRVEVEDDIFVEVRFSLPGSTGSLFIYCEVQVYGAYSSYLIRSRRGMLVKYVNYVQIGLTLHDKRVKCKNMIVTTPPSQAMNCCVCPVYRSAGYRTFRP